MTDTLIKDKNNESLQNDFEPLETDENQEQKPKKNIKSKLIKYALLFIPIFLIIAGIIYFKCFHSSSKLSDDEIWQEYNNLGKKDGNLRLFAFDESFLANKDTEILVINVIFHLDKNDVDKDRLINAIKILVRNQGALQTTFYEKDNGYGIKFDPNLYPEIITANINESDYENYYFNIGKELNFPLGGLMYKIYLVTTEKSIICMFFFHHAIYDVHSNKALAYTLDHAYLGDIDEEQLKKNDLFYASLYKYNLNLRNETFIKEVSNYYLNNYDLGRTFKCYTKDQITQETSKDSVTFYTELSVKSLKDKVFRIFDGNLHKLNYFNMICHLYTLYLYNKNNEKEDFIPEITYVRHGRNLTKFRYTIGPFLQLSIIKYDFFKNYEKIKDKIYLNVQKVYDDVKKQFDEQKFISQYYNSFENYNYFNSLPNLSMSQLSLWDELDFMPDSIFGKELLEKTKAGLYLGDQGNRSSLFIFLFFQSGFVSNGIVNVNYGLGSFYKEESLKKMSNLFLKVVDALADGFLSDDKMVEIKDFD